MRELLTASDSLAGLSRIASEIHGGPPGEVLLVGIRRGGVPLAEHLAGLLASLGRQALVGSVDITLYRDDAATALPSPQIGPTELPLLDVGGHRVVLVDDVLYTGRTVRAALDVVLDYGRASAVELAVLVDRGGRELPIQPTYVAHTELIPETQRVDVLTSAGGWRAVAEDIQK